MDQDYKRYQCRICGQQVFVLIASAVDEETPNEGFEMTCSRGHTDQYDSSNMAKETPKPMARLKMKRAYAGMG